MSQFEEFVPAEKRKSVGTEPRNLRHHERLSLRSSNDECLTLACDGVTVDLIKRSWWRKRKIGVANIKDIGMGGIGLLSAVPLIADQVLHIEYKGYLQQIRIARSWPINSRLHFAGAKWVNQDENEIIQIINIIHPQSTYKAIDI